VTLSDEQHQRVQDHLEKQDIGSCCRCDCDELEVDSSVVTTRVYGSNEVVPLIQVYCPACYRIELFSARLLGVQPSWAE
jgi:hypothetical protein